MKQSSGMLFDEYTTKVRKLSAQPGSIAELERRMAARMGQNAFEQMRERTLASAARWQADAPSTPSTGGLSVPPPPDSTMASTPAPTPEPAVDYAQLRNNKMRAGAIVLGVSAVVTLVGALLIPAGLGIVSAFIFTAGGILLLAGVITLIVGALMRKA
jgi:hypothetical protein